MKFRTILLGLAALFVAFNSAFFSVNGLSKLFAGATISVLIMASSLEIAKLIGASFLYNYWNQINKILRIYLTIAIFVLMIITSAGIYGYLTSAYQTTADKLDVSKAKIELVERKKLRYKTQLTEYISEKKQLAATINNYAKGLSNNVIQYKDKETGKIITTTSVNTRRVLTAELTDTKRQRNNINNKIEVMNDSLTSLDNKILHIKSAETISAEVGPLRFLAKALGWKMNTIVNWLTLIIIFVFDPLAVVLIVAFNTALKVDENTQHKKKISKPKPLYGGSELVTNINDIEVTEPETIIADTVSDKSKTTDDSIVKLDKLQYEKGGWRNSYNGASYYHHPWFDWNKIERWVNDPKAVKFWMNTQGGTQAILDGYRTKYPTNFTSKTY